MYPNLQVQEDLKKVQKERDYYKWLNENPDATALMKRNARWILLNCDTWREPQGKVKEEDIIPANKEGMNLLLKSLEF